MEVIVTLTQLTRIMVFSSMTTFSIATIAAGVTQI